jgi:hypothetical protein
VKKLNGNKDDVQKFKKDDCPPINPPKFDGTEPVSSLLFNALL